MFLSICVSSTMSRTTTSCFFSVSLSLPCCQLVAFLRPFGPPQSCRFSPPGASVTVCHIEGLEVCGFCPVPRVFFLLEHLLQLLDLKMKFVVSKLSSETFCMFFFYFLEDTLRLPQPSIDHFHFLFCLSGVLCRDSPPPVLSL